MRNIRVSYVVAGANERRLYSQATLRVTHRPFVSPDSNKKRSYIRKRRDEIPEIPLSPEPLNVHFPQRFFDVPFKFFWLEEAFDEILLEKYPRDVLQPEKVYVRDISMKTFDPVA